MKYKKSKKKEQGGNELGHDSFLDLVSNIVGILIILVMVAGIRAQSSANNMSTGNTESVAPTDAQNIQNVQSIKKIQTAFQEYQRQADKTVNLYQDIETLKQKEQIIAAQLHGQVEQYDAVFDQKTTLLAAIDTFAEEKNQTTKEQVEYQRQILEVNAKLEQIQKTKNYLAQIRPKATVLENIPTPLGKTVDEKEIHFRLLGGKIAYVPWLELMLQLKGNIGREQDRYFKQKTSSGKVGPVDGFELEFLLAMFDVMMPDGGGKRLELQYAEMTPVSENLGEPASVALSNPQSAFHQKISLFRKGLYSVTIWVYPDSFEEYQKLRQYLSERGYAVAARPLMMDEVISGSPRGTKSTAQ